MLSISTILKHYKRKEVQDEIVLHSKDREVGIRFGDKFGKRPDVITYPADIIELAKQGATSFHASEELWKNPLHLDPKMRKKELDDLRIGWDLVLDIDCPYWEYSKLIAHLMIKALKKHNVKSISCKFSGNKGFHIGVPFEAFPEHIGIGESRLWFPEGVKIIAMYLTDFIDSKETEFELTKSILKNKKIEDLAKELKIPYEKLVKKVCSKCGKEAKKNLLISKQSCPYCSEHNDTSSEKNFFKCKKCNKLVKTERFHKYSCKNCDNKEFEDKFDISQILDVDTLLISSRHLYRMPYSLHEKSGLCSIPIDPDKVREFKKEYANPDNLQISRFRFLDKKNVPKNNAANLFDQAGYWYKRQSELDDLKEKYSLNVKRSYEEPTVALDEQFFPPCIKKILGGLPDGRKRSLFILTNFLSKLGWSYDAIGKKLADWNKNNEEPLREVYLTGQLRYHQQNKQKILPPNCDNKSYYVDLRICHPDNLCSKIRNPVQYSMRKARYSEDKKPKRQKPAKKEKNQDKKSDTKN